MGDRRQVPTRAPAQPAAPSSQMSVNKTVVAMIRLRVQAGKASPSPPVGPALGQHGLNIMDFCKDFNAKTTNVNANVTIPVKIEAYKDRTFSWEMTTPPVSHLLKDMMGLKKGSSNPSKEFVGEITPLQLLAVAQMKHKDPSSAHCPIEGIYDSVVGTAKSMGLKVKAEIE